MRASQRFDTKSVALEIDFGIFSTESDESDDDSSHVCIYSFPFSLYDAPPFNMWLSDAQSSLSHFFHAVYIFNPFVLQK